MLRTYRRAARWIQKAEVNANVGSVQQLRHQTLQRHGYDCVKEKPWTQRRTHTTGFLYCSRRIQPSLHLLFVWSILQHIKQFVQKTHHRQAQERPRQAHDGLETSRGRFKTGQSRPRQAQDRSKTGQSRPRQAQDRPRQLQDKAHERPRQAKKGLRRVPDGPTKAKTGSRWAKTSPQSRFETNFGSSECLKTTVFPMVSP